MTGEEVKAAFMEECPVVHGGITYQKISAIIYRKAAGGGIYIQAELLDRSGHSVTIAAAGRVERGKDREI